MAEDFSNLRICLWHGESSRWASKPEGFIRRELLPRIHGASLEEFTGCWVGWMPTGRGWMNYSLACDEEFDSTFGSRASL
jgi:hypothetical protein